MFHEPIRWWIPAPGEDESIRSVVGRAANCYGFVDSCGARLLAYPFTSNEQMLSIDSGIAGDLRELASRLSIKLPQLFDHLEVDSPYLIIEIKRGAYCPRCWAQADRKGLPRTFRRACQSIFALSCPIHSRVPLLQASILSRDRYPVETELRPKHTPRARRFLNWVDGFTAKLAACLFEGDTWPTHWCGDSNAAKVLLIACVTNFKNYLEYSLIHCVIVPLHLSPWVERPAGRFYPLSGDPWDAIRELHNPKVRRLVFWLVGWLTVSDMPVDLWLSDSARHFAYCYVCSFRKLPLPTRYAKAALATLDQAITRRDRQWRAIEMDEDFEWGDNFLAWKEPLLPCKPK